VVGQQLEEILIGRKVHFRTAAIGLNDLSRASVGRQQHTADLIFLNPLNKIAVTKRACLGLRTTGTTEESRCDHYDRKHQKGPKADVSPAFVQGSSASDEGMLIGS
jgi:hypothetical protein